MLCNNGVGYSCSSFATCSLLWSESRIRNTFLPCTSRAIAWGSPHHYYTATKTAGGHNYASHNYDEEGGHNYAGHNYEEEGGRNYMGHNYISHNYVFEVDPREAAPWRQRRGGGGTIGSARPVGLYSYGLM